MKYESFFYSNSLQFGFKPGFSTILCTATVRNVVSRYMHNGSYILGCFLDASKAFDLVDHTLLDRFTYSSSNFFAFLVLYTTDASALG